MECKTTTELIESVIVGRKQRRFTKSEKLALNRRKKYEHEVLQELGRKHASDEAAAAAKQAEEVQYRQDSYTSGLSELVTLNPEQLYKQESWLARKLGMTMNKLGLGAERTVAGQVRKELINTQLEAGQLVETVARYEVIGDMKLIQKGVDDVRRGLGLSKSEADALFQEVIEAGQIPMKRAAYGNTLAQDELLDKMYSEFLERTKALGVTDEQLNGLLDISITMSSRFDKVRLAAEAAGLHIDVVKNIGYFARQLTPDAQRRLTTLAKPSGPMYGSQLGKSIHQKRRETDHILVEDATALAEIFAPGAGTRYNAAVYKMTGLSPDVINELWKKENTTSVVEQARDAMKDLTGYRTLTEARVTKDEFAEEAASRLGITVEEFTNNTKKYPVKRPEAIEIRRDVQTKKLGMTAKEFKEKTREAQKAAQKYTPESFVEDEIVRAAIARNPEGAVQSVADLREMRDALLREAGYKDGPELLDLAANNPKAFIEAIHKNLGTEQLDYLVDAGIISKVPMQTQEVAVYMAEQLRMPYAKPGEVFELGFDAAFEAYTVNLRKAAGESAMFKRLVDEGLKKAWTATEGMYQNYPKYANYVSLKDINLKRFIEDEELLKQVEGMRVHPMVFDQIDGLMNIAGNPNKMGDIGRAFQWFVKASSTSIMFSGGGLMLGVPFVSRQVLSNALQFAAGGGHLHRIPMAGVQLGKLFSKGIDSFDNAKPYIKDGAKYITHQEFMRRFMSRYGLAVVPGTAGDDIARVAWNISPQQALKHFEQVYRYTELFDTPLGKVKGAVDYAAGKALNGLDAAFSPFAKAASMVELTHKLALAQSVGHIEGVSDAVRKAHSVVSRAHTGNDTMAKVFDHVDNYFLDYSNLGEAQKWVGRNVMQFSSFILMNPPMVLRDAMRNPASFMAYNRLGSFMNSSLEGPAPMEAGFSEAEGNEYAMFLYRDKKDGRVVTLFPSNVDARLDASQWAKETLEKGVRLAGAGTGSNYDRRKDAVSRYSLFDFVGDTVSDQLSVGWKSAAELATGQKFGTDKALDEQFSEFLGIQVPPEVGWLMTKVPFVMAANKQLGGRGEILDPVSQQTLSPAQPSILGVTPRRLASRSETERFYTEKTLDRFSQGLVAVLGVKVKAVDLDHNMAYTFSDIKASMEELKKTIIKEEKRLKDMTAASDSKALHPDELIPIERLRQAYANFAFDALRLDAYRIKTNRGESFNDAKIYKALRESRKRINSLPVPSKAGRELLEGIVQGQAKLTKELNILDTPETQAERRKRLQVLADKGAKENLKVGETQAKREEMFMNTTIGVGGQ